MYNEDRVLRTEGKLLEVLAFQSWMDYLEYYPDEGEEGFDGVHFGGIKGISPDAPEKEKAAFRLFQKEEAEAQQQGIRLW